MTRLSLAILGIATVLGTLPGGCADMQPNHSDDVARENFLKYAGPPVDSFTYLGHYNGFRALGGRDVVVWTSINDAWLITVMAPCPNLPYANGLGMTSAGHTITSRVDWVHFDRGRCRIESIRHVDYLAMKQAGIAGP